MTTYTEFPSGRVLCCMRHNAGSIVCTSDTTYGEYDERAENAYKKASEAYQSINCNWSQPIGKIVYTAV